MADERPSRTDRLREQIASKLREKTPEKLPPAATDEPARPATPPPPKQEPVEELSTLETAKHILSTQIALTGPSLTDLAVLCRQLATLIDVGIPLLRALKILGERTQHPQLRHCMREISREVEQGASLSAAMGKHPRVLPELIVNIIRIGESGGVLEESLRRLAEIYERRAHIKRNVISAMFYPIAAVCVAIGVLIIIFAFAIPVFTEVYSQKEGVELPDITQKVIAISDFVRGQWMWYIPLTIAAISLLMWFGRTVRGRWIFDRLRLTLPIMGKINTQINVARFTRTLSNLLAAGIPLIEALGSTAKASDNVVIGDALMKTRSAVEEGGGMEQALRDTNVIPPMVVDMIAIGDETGTLDSMLDRMADSFEDEVDASVRGLTSVIEPLLIIFLGGVVLVIAIAILLPYWSIGDLVE